MASVSSEPWTGMLGDHAEAVEPPCVGSRPMSMRRRQPMASRAALALVTGTPFILVAACEASPVPTSNQAFQGATVTARPSTSPRTEASTTAGVSDIRLIEEAEADPRPLCQQSVVCGQPGHHPGRNDDSRLDCLLGFHNRIV